MSVTISVRPNGPLLVSGDLEVIGVDGNSLDLKGEERIALCRCGQSANKPFCDGSHQSTGFSDPASGS